MTFTQRRIQLLTLIIFSMIPCHRILNASSERESIPPISPDKEPYLISIKSLFVLKPYTFTYAVLIEL